MTASEAFKLIYHAGIPGRAEFVRLYFEATGTPYEDQALTKGQSCIEPYLEGTFTHGDDQPTPFAPPILEHSGRVIFQTPNIIMYLSTLLPPFTLEGENHDQNGEISPPAKKKSKTEKESTIYEKMELLLTILDFANEAHDTHHPIAVSAYYEDQKPAALEKTKVFREERLPKFFRFFESTLEKAGSGFMLKDGATFVDLALYQVVDGLYFAFPNLLKKIESNYPKVIALHAKVRGSPRISAYLDSDRRQPYSMGVFRYYKELDEPSED